MKLVLCNFLFSATFPRYIQIIVGLIAMWTTIQYAKGVSVCSTHIETRVVVEWDNTTEMPHKMFNLVECLIWLSVYMVSFSG